MRIAVYAGNTSQLDNAGEYFKKWKKRGVLFKEDYFLSTEELCRAVEEKNYSAIIVYVDSDWTAKESVFNQLKQKEQDSLIIYICGRRDQWKKLSRAKYTAVFNGQPIVYKRSAGKEKNTGQGQTRCGGTETFQLPLRTY